MPEMHKNRTGVFSHLSCPGALFKAVFIFNHQISFGKCFFIKSFVILSESSASYFL